MNLCPSYKHLRAAKTEGRSTTADDNDIFYPEKYDLIDDEKSAHIKAICANTPYPVSIRLLACWNLKDQPVNYCGDLSDLLAKKKICESNKTEYVSFYMDKSEHGQSENKVQKNPVYLVVFIRYFKDDEKIPGKIVLEVKRTAKWLGIDGGVIQCYVFYFKTNSLCNTFDLGTLKKAYTEKCPDSKYSFQFHYVNPSKKPQLLYVNGGSPRFEFKVQEE
jgi:hypothetical protein